MPAIDLGQLRSEETTRANKARIEHHGKCVSFLNKLAAEVKHPIICYVTAARQQLGAQIGGDTIRFFREHLDLLGSSNEALGLYLVTRGGNTLVPTRLTALFREHCKKLVVYVPYMAHSAGTLIALGADEIVMGPMGELGPVDPSVGNQFNPTFDPNDTPGGKLPIPRPRIPISVEDVTAYLTLAREKAGLGSGASMLEAFKALTDKIHPLALGNIQRQHMLIRRLVRRLLGMHMSQSTDKEKIEQITETLTEKLYAHEYVITRQEARDDLSLKVVYPSQLLEELMWALYKRYEEYLLLEQEIDPGELLGPAGKKYAILDVAAVESVNRLDLYSCRGWISRKGPEEVNFDIERVSWEQLVTVGVSDEDKAN